METGAGVLLAEFLEVGDQALPAPSARAALKRTHDIGSDPAAIKAPLLRPDVLPVYPTRIHQRRVKGRIILDPRVSEHRVRVEPGGLPLRPLVGLNVVVARNTLPLAERLTPGEREMLHPDTPGRYVVHRRVARL